MLDSKYLRQDVEQTAARLAARGYELDVAKVTELEEQRKTLQVKRKNFKVNVMQAQKQLVKPKLKAKTHSLYLMQWLT